MVYFKELVEQGITYLYVLDQEEDALKNGTSFAIRHSLRDRDSDDDSSKIDPGQFPLEMSWGLESTQSGSHARRILQSSMQTWKDRGSEPTLGQEIVSGSKVWKSNCVKLCGTFENITGYWEWAEDVLARFGDSLKASSLYHAVHASLFTYDKNVHIMRAFFECWCIETNTLHTAEGEFSISLKDLGMLGRLPICGEIYDETIPRLRILKGQDSRRSGKVPKTCEHLFAAYHFLTKRSKGRSEVLASEWIAFWHKKEILNAPPGKNNRKIVKRSRCAEDPSGEIIPRPTDEWTPAEKEVFKEIEVDRTSRAKTYLAAFLSCWLCVFALPADESRTIRPATFEIASLMADGQVFSLAIPVLASIYSGIREVVTHKNPAYSNASFPAHYLYAWIAQYFGTHRHVKRLPHTAYMIRYSGGRGARTYKADEARELIHGGNVVNVDDFALSKQGEDLLVDNGKLSSTKFAYLVSLRSSYLPIRRGNSFYIESYVPFRFGRQFGFCQDLPGLLPRKVDQRIVTRREASKYWGLLLFPRSKSRVLLPRPQADWRTNVTLDFKAWWKKAVIHDLRVKMGVFLRGVTNDPKRGKKAQDDDVAKTLEARPEVAGVRKRPIDECSNDDVEKEGDPKHERGCKAKVHQSPIHPIDRVFDGVISCSSIPSQELEGDLNLEVGTTVPTTDPPTLVSQRPLGKGKEIALMNKITPMDVGCNIASQNSSAGSSSVNAEDDSVVGPASASLGLAATPVAIAAPSPLIVDATCLPAGSAVPTPAVVVDTPPVTPAAVPAQSMTTYFLPTEHKGVFEDAIKNIHTMFLNELKSAEYSEVKQVAARARYSYKSIGYLKGDPSWLKEQVDSYVGAVDAYLMVDRVCKERRRPEEVEHAIVQQHHDLDRIRALTDQVLSERAVIDKESSAILTKIASLEAELRQACEASNDLEKQAKVKDQRLSDLHKEAEGAEKALAELEAQPMMSAEEEAQLQRQKTDLDEMRASLGAGL